MPFIDKSAILPGRSFLPLFILTLTCAAQSAHAQVPHSVNPGVVLRNLEEEKKRSQTREVIITLPAMDETAGDLSAEKVFVLQGVIIDDAKVYSPEQLAPLAQDFVGQEVSFADLNVIAAALTKKYREDGYIFSRVIIPPQKLKDGIVHFQAIEGQLENVEIVGSDNDKSGLIGRMAEKIKNSGAINARTLERYLLLMDDLPGVTVHSLVRPSKTQGAGDLVITVEREKFDGSASLDNRGTQFLGSRRISAELNGNNLFGWDDRTSLHGAVTSQTKEMRFADITHEERIGTEGLRADIRYAITATEPGGRIKDLEIVGDSTLMEIGAFYPLVRGREANLSLEGGLTVMNSKTDVLTLRASEDRVRSIHMDWHFDMADAIRGVTMLDFGTTQGLAGLGATEEGLGRTRANGKQDFLRLNATLTRIQGLWGNWSLMASAIGQQSSDPLLASEEFSVGGSNYGRAYDSGEIVGDKGMAGALELRYGASVEGNNILTSWQGYGFYDLGKVYNIQPVVGEQEVSSMASTGIGVRFNLKNDFFGYIEVAHPLNHMINSENDQKNRVFMSLSKKF